MSAEILDIVAIFASTAALVLSAAAFILMLRRVQPVEQPKKNHASKHRQDTELITVIRQPAKQEEFEGSPFDRARELLTRPGPRRSSS